MKKTIKKILGKTWSHKLNLFIKKYVTNYSISIFSQDGEDIILKEFLSGKNTGFYVDIGAHHPMRFSNTYLFYKKGWRGINIDAMPGSMQLFNKKRKKDINLEVGIAEKEGFLTYYMFDASALNGFSETISLERNSCTKFKVVGKKKIKTFPLSKILDKHLPPNTKIDFMNIDVEGFDFQVLKSNNWNKYVPEFILVECTSKNLDEVQNDSIYIFLVEKGYVLVAKTYRTCIFRKQL
jgi:FkbM family methyltransferase